MSATSRPKQLSSEESGVGGAGIWRRALGLGGECGNKPIAVDTIMATECACVQAWWRVCTPGRCVCVPSAWSVRAGVVRVSSACVRAACACVVHGWLCTSQSVARV